MPLLKEIGFLFYLYKNTANAFHIYNPNQIIRIQKSKGIVTTASRTSRIVLHATQPQPKTENNNIKTKENDNIPYFFSRVNSKDDNNLIHVNKLEANNVNNAIIEREVSSTASSLSGSNASDLGSGLLWRGVVVGLCVLWASNFAAAKLVMGEPGVDSSLYALSRFGLAAFALLPGAIAAVNRGVIDWETVKKAGICGSWVAFGYLGQTLALVTTTASRACVICTLHCVFVAVTAEAIRVSRASSLATTPNTSFDLTRLVPAAIAVAGVAIIELKGAGGAPTIGDALSFAQPIGFGLGYIKLEELMRERPEAALPVSAIKLAVVATASFIFFELSPLILHTGAALAPRIPDFTPIVSSPLALGGILYTGLITTALALWVESIAFKRVPATDASIILTTEPLFAAIAGALTLGETFVASDYVGATLILAACVYAVLLDGAAADDQCDVEDEVQGKCGTPRSLPISAE